MKVTLDGEQISWNPPPANPVIPDLSKVKQLCWHINRMDFQPYPAYFYHPTEEPDPQERRRATLALAGAPPAGLSALWDWNDDSPYQAVAGNNPIQSQQAVY